MMLFVALLMLIETSADAQDTLKRRYAGIGVRAGRDLISQFSTPNPAGLVLNLDPLPYLRLECVIGMNNQMREQTIRLQKGSSSYETEFELESKMKSLGFGLFLQHRIQKTNFYMGYRYTSLEHRQDWLKTDSQYDPNFGYTETAQIATDRSTYAIHSAVLGCEHFLAERFSVGGELTFNTGKANFHISGKSNNGQLRYTDAMLVFRFYPL